MSEAKEWICLEGAARLEVGTTRGIAIPRTDETGFLVSTPEGLRAWRNRCDHWPVPLDMDDQDFLSPRTGLVTCKSHGAGYHPASGECLHGPCRGAHLVALPLRLEGDDVWIDPSPVFRDPMAG